MSLKQLLPKGSAAFIIVLLLLAAGGAGMAATSVGSTIMNQAVAQYEDASGTLRLANSNAVLLQVQQVRAVTVTPGPGPVQLHHVVRNQTVQYAFKITNGGNGPETIALALMASNLGMPPQVELFLDENDDGVIDSGDTPLPPTLGFDGYEYMLGPLAAGTSVNVIARFAVSSLAVPGDEIALHLAAASVADPAVNDHSPTILFRVKQGDVATAMLARDKGVASRGDFITYTLTVINPTDDMLAHVKATVAVPDHTAFVPGSLQTNGTVVAPDPLFPYEHTITNLAAGAAYEIVYAVQVNASAPAGYVINEATLEVGTDPAFVTNQVKTQVLAKLGVLLEEDGGNYDVAPTTAGTTYVFPYRVTNTGSGTDTIFIEAAIDNGWPVALYRADGVTSLPKQSGRYTVGQLAADESAAFAVAVSVPAGAPSDNAVHTVTTKVVSATDSMINEAKNATLSNVAGPGLELSVVGMTHQFGVPGTVVVYDLLLKNTGPNTDMFTLAKVLAGGGYDTSALTVQLLDADGNLLGSLPVAGNDEQQLKLLVAIAAGAAPTAHPVGIQVSAVSQYDPLLLDSVALTLDVNHHVAVAVAPHRTGAVNRGSFVLYTLHVQNQGNVTTDVDLGFAAAGASPWLQYNFIDETTAALSPELTMTLAPNEIRTVSVRVDAPTSVPAGVVDNVAVQATVTGAVVDEAVITTFVAGGELKLHNEADVAHVKPGDHIVYTVTGTNLTVGPVNALVIYETVPDHTVFVAAAAVAGAQLAYSTDGGATWSGSEPADVRSITSVRWTFDNTLGANEHVTVSFMVQVK